MTDTPDCILPLNAVLYRKMQNGTFPKNVQISERCAGRRGLAINA